MKKKAFRYVAVAGNAVAMIAGLVLMREVRGAEFLPFFGLFFILPMMNIAGLMGGIDVELRRLEREVRMAELRKRLKDLS